ncbi:MAG: GHMP kinase [Gemmatimonadetes bacterium]|nr:MAG: GHMP kinase [Gemmatimonadota bacterium]
MIYRSKAPLRISFAGGGTDVSPYPEERGGVVLNVTIDKYAYASLKPRDDRKMSIHSLDYDIVAKYNMDEELTYNGELDLVKAVARNLEVDQGFDLFIHSDAPPGSGLGSSSTMCVALVGVFQQWLNLPLTHYDIAEVTYHAERIDLQITGGRQDQYAATFGGFNFIEFLKDATVVNPLRIRPEYINELHYRLLLCYTGKTRLSANIVANHSNAFRRKEKTVVEALDQTKALAIDMKNCLLRGELDYFGELLHHAWLHKKQFNDQISNAYIDTLYDTARNNGAVGGKILGAGGGGYLLLYCPFDKKHIIAKQLEALGGQIVEFSFEFQGLQTWQI